MVCSIHTNCFNFDERPRDFVAFGIGTWFLFTFLWALITSMVAYASGVEIETVKTLAGLLWKDSGFTLSQRCVPSSASK